MPHEAEIWKLQRSIATSEGFGQILVYNEDRSKMGQFDTTPDFDDLFFEDELKVFVHGTMNDKGEINVESDAEWQEW